MACLDTSVLIDLMAPGARPARRKLARLLRRLVADGERLSTTRFTVAELWVGVCRSRDPSGEQVAVEAALADLEILEFDEPASRVFGELTAYLQALGRPAGDMDVLIASVALVNGQTLVTRNVKHFLDLPGLSVAGY